ncbi:MAG: hypothetical protein WC415_03360 [Patescibacteria group bacterium]|jgi:hypothetical protein
MWVIIGQEKAVEICNEVVQNVLNMYPEEELIHRPIFENAFNDDYIKYSSLVSESDKMFIPWQMFFLDLKNYKNQINQIEKLRKNKFSPKFFAKRRGVGKITSKRIIDRMIRLQNFIINNYNLSINNFCGLLKGKTQSQSMKIIIDYFGIDIEELSCRTKDSVLKLLIEKIELKNINISRGVLKGGILPEIVGVNKVYKNTSGFVVKDVRIPFIFLPDEINPDEVVGRRIYTLIYLLACIGLDDYNFYIESEFKASALKMDGSESKKHDIVTGILLPHEETEKLKYTDVTKTTISYLASKYKITPTAIITTLKKREVITQDEYNLLLPDPYKPQKKISSPRKPSKITTSVEKFCGKVVFNLINTGIKSKSLNSIEAQYLIFGRVKKNKYKEYCRLINI